MRKKEEKREQKEKKKKTRKPLTTTPHAGLKIRDLEILVFQDWLLSQFCLLQKKKYGQTAARYSWSVAGAIPNSREALHCDVNL